jgi:hypothetical protein
VGPKKRESTAHSTLSATIQGSAMSAPKRVNESPVAVHVTGSDAEALARGARSGLLGRPRGAGPPPEQLREISESAARTLLADAVVLLGRSAEQVALRGRPEREVVAAAARADLLVMSRDGDRSRPGPKSAGHAARSIT